MSEVWRLPLREYSFPAFESLFETADGFVQVFERGVDLQGDAEGPECALRLAEFHEALTHASRRAEMVRVQLERLFAVLNGTGEFAALEMPDGSLVIGFRIRRRLSNQSVELGAARMESAR